MNCILINGCAVSFPATIAIIKAAKVIKDEMRSTGTEIYSET
jgi:hypothetical protein